MDYLHRQSIYKKIIIDLHIQEYFFISLQIYNQYYNIMFLFFNHKSFLDGLQEVENKSKEYTGIARMQYLIMKYGPIIVIITILSSIIFTIIGIIASIIIPIYLSN